MQPTNKATKDYFANLRVFWELPAEICSEHNAEWLVVDQEKIFGSFATLREAVNISSSDAVSFTPYIAKIDTTNTTTACPTFLHIKSEAPHEELEDKAWDPNEGKVVPANQFTPYNSFGLHGIYTCVLLQTEEMKNNGTGMPVTFKMTTRSTLTYMKDSIFASIGHHEQFVLVNGKKIAVFPYSIAQDINLLGVQALEILGLRL
jgi:hypothetical protein